MMKKLLRLFCFASFLSLSCSNAGNVTYTGAGSDTLKQVVQNKEDAAIWTRELESVRLTKNLRQIDSVSDSINLSPDVLKVSSVQDGMVYPKLKEFGSLDVSEIPSDVYKTCRDFCNSLSNDLYSVQSYFASAFLFSYVFFLDDLKKGFFKGGLPESPEKGKAENGVGSSNYVFDKYLIGRSYESGDELQIPIRFYKKSDYIDVVIFVSLSTNQLSQIKIDCWSR